jgi:hypothetical protein
MELRATPYLMGKDIVKTMKEKQISEIEMFNELVESGISAKCIEQAVRAYRQGQKQATWE